MTKHLRRDLDGLERAILRLGSMVETAIRDAGASLTERRVELAEQVIAGDERIDATEVEVEEECLKCLALHQPLAADLRFLVAVLKVNNDLERMGDLAVNVAERAVYLGTHEPLSRQLDFGRMVELVNGMVKDSLTALLQTDAGLAKEVCRRDDQVDAINKQHFQVLEEYMIEEPAVIKRAVHSLSASRHLERIADLATNIAEDVVFMVRGEVIRHRAEDYRLEPSDRPPS